MTARQLCCGFFTVAQPTKLSALRTVRLDKVKADLPLGYTLPVVAALTLLCWFSLMGRVSERREREGGVVGVGLDGHARSGINARLVVVYTNI